jgi:Ni/Fe-hydrogenase subunit HybB-like protein
VKGPPLVLLAWALLLAVHTTVLVALGGDTLEIALLGGAAAGVAVLALIVAVRRRAENTRVLSDVSLPTALAAIAVAGLVVGSELGRWLLLISGGLLIVALGGLVRE